MPSGEPLLTRAIILKLVPFRESDRVVHLYTEALGKVSAMARGGRQSKRRFGGALQAFVLLEVELRARARAELMELSSATPRQAFAGLATDPLRLGRAGYLCELVDVLTRERDPMPAVLEDLASVLTLCADTDIDGGALLRVFEVRLLSHLGLWPDQRSCAVCRADLQSGRGAATREGIEGLCCRRCGDSPVAEPVRRALTPMTLNSVRDLELTRAQAIAAGRHTLSRIQSLASRQLRSLAFLRQLER